MLGQTFANYVPIFLKNQKVSSSRSLANKTIRLRFDTKTSFLGCLLAKKVLGLGTKSTQMCLPLAKINIDQVNPQWSG